MTRSESLQTGTAAMPRILMPSANTQFVFSLGLATHSAYPGAHPNAIEYIAVGPGGENFRFHEIVLAPVPAMGSVPARSRGVGIDDDKCTAATPPAMMLNFTMVPGTTGTQWAGESQNKPNWDTYDSWAGLMLSTATAFTRLGGSRRLRKLFNLWNWRSNEPVRAVLEQLQLQPPGFRPTTPSAASTAVLTTAT